MPPPSRTGEPSTYTATASPRMQHTGPQGDLRPPFTHLALTGPWALLALLHHCQDGGCTPVLRHTTVHQKHTHVKLTLRVCSLPVQSHLYKETSWVPRLHFLDKYFCACSHQEHRFSATSSSHPWRTNQFAALRDPHECNLVTSKETKQHKATLAKHQEDGEEE